MIGDNTTNSVVIKRNQIVHNADMPNTQNTITTFVQVQFVNYHS